MVNVTIEPGTYVLAVSGGVDSMVLLDILSKLPDVQLIVAHFDHGIRPDSVEDRRLVQQRAGELGLQFRFAEGELSPLASEAVARKVRYAFLKKVRDETGATAVITAHHHDDVLETALLNLLRGTNRRGLSSLKSTEAVLRPLLAYAKSELLAYAKDHGLAWREDSTNQDEAYLRNYVRHQLVAGMEPDKRAELAGLIQRMTAINQELDELLETELDRLLVPEGLERQGFVMLNHTLAREIMAQWLRRAGLWDYDKQILERLVVSAKTGRPGTVYDVRTGVRLRVDSRYLALDNYQR